MKAEFIKNKTPNRTYMPNTGMSGATPSIMGVEIFILPTSASVTYTDALVGYNGGYMDYTSGGYVPNNISIAANIVGGRPCVIKDGKVLWYLDFMDMTYFSSELGYGTLGRNPLNPSYNPSTDPVLPDWNLSDIMIQFQHCWMSIIYQLTGDGYKVNIRLANYKVDSTYTDIMFSHNGATYNTMYIGAFMAGNDVSGQLVSKAGKQVLNNLTRNDIITAASQRGFGYGSMTWYKHMFLQALSLMAFKTRNSQLAGGDGYWLNPANFVLPTTGNSLYRGTTNNGAWWGDNTGAKSSRFFHIEDAWGGLGCFVDGIRWIGANQHWQFTTDYTSPVKTTSTLYPYPSWMSQFSEDILTGFLPRATSGSSTQYYCDMVDYPVSKPAYNMSVMVGCGENTGINQRPYGGIFNFRALDESTPSNLMGARLCFHDDTIPQAWDTWIAW